MLRLLAQIFPEPYVICTVTPITIVCIVLFLFISGSLKINYKIKTNYTRKLFHILVFTFAGMLGFFFDFRAVMLFGGITGLIVIYAIYLGDGHILYEGMAREQDEPHRSFYIGVPFITTAIAGLSNNILFGQLALVGYLVAGWGDASGEPIGVRFGKHKYKVPSLHKTNKTCERSIEGSLGIMLFSSLGTVVALLVLGGFPLMFLIIIAILVGLATALVEAFSPHGIDNFTTQVAACAVCFALVGLV